MKLTILGTSDYQVTTAMASAGFCIEQGSSLLKFDFGYMNLQQMATAGIDWRVLDAIFLSHIHPDHVSDLWRYAQAYTVDHMLGKTFPKTPKIYGPIGLQPFFTELQKVAKVPWDAAPACQLVELEDNTLTIGDVTITSARMLHTDDVMALGFRIDSAGKVLCYSGDAGYSENLVKLAQQADVFLADCNFENSREPGGHMRPTDIARIANEAGVKKVVLTHMPVLIEEREKRLRQTQEEFFGEVVLATDGMQLDI